MEAKQATRDGIIDEIGAMLKKSYHAYADGANPPSEEQEVAEFRRMAEEVVAQRQFRLPGSDEIVTLDRFKSEYSRLAQFAKGEEKQRLESQLAMLDEVPDNQAIDQIATAVDAGVKKSTGFFNSFSGFLSTIGNFIMAAFEWIGQLFSGGDDKKTFWELVGARSQNSASQAVNHELSQLREQNPNLRGVLNEQRMGLIDAELREQVMRTATGNTSERESRIERAEMLTPSQLGIENIPQRVLDEVDNTIDAQFAYQDNPNTPEVEGQLRATLESMIPKDGESPGMLKMDQQKITDIQRELKEVTAALVQNPNTTNMSDQQLRDHIASEIADEIGLRHQNSQPSQTNQSSSNNFLASMVTGAQNLFDPKKLIGGQISDEQLEMIREGAKVYNGGQGIDVAQAPVQSTPGSTDNRLASR